ncbi:hypothetical protein CRYUN_Cryun37aG0015200 [Craigia yunnanensis]
MDFLKVKKFRKAHKPDTEKDLEDKPVSRPEEPKNENGATGGADSGDNDLNKSTKVDPAAEVEDDDDDFITNEVKRRLKELRRNSFMVLIPEEEEVSHPEDEEEEAGETSSSEWRDVEAEGRQWWGGFDAVYEKYCERMLFFDRMIAQQLKEAGSTNPSTPPKSASKKLASPLRCLSLKKIEESDEETEHLQQPIIDPYQDLEIAAEIYARARNILPKLLQIPNIQGLSLRIDGGKCSDQKEKVEEEPNYLVLAPDIIRIIESSILTFQLFVKLDLKKNSSVLNLFGNQNPMATPLQQVQSLLEKKGMKLKELCKKRKGWKKKSWPVTREDVPLLLGLIDIKIIIRVLRMSRISKEQLFWCEEKIKKLDLSDGKLQRDPSPILFPC